MLFGEWNEDTEEWSMQNGTAIMEAASYKEAVNKAQETIGLYVIECVEQ